MLMISAVQQSAIARDSWGTQRASSLSGGRLSEASGESPTLRAGFGDGTVSVPVATVKTLGKGLEGARQVVPTLSDLQQQLRSRLAEERTSAADTASTAEKTNAARGASTTGGVGFVGTRRQAASQGQGIGGKSDLNASANKHAAQAMFEIQDNEQAAYYSRTGTGKRADQSPSLDLFA